MEKFWEAMSCDMIGRGFVASMNKYALYTGKHVKMQYNTMFFFSRW